MPSLLNLFNPVASAKNALNQGKKALTTAKDIFAKSKLTPPPSKGDGVVSKNQTSTLSVPPAASPKPSALSSAPKPNVQEQAIKYFSQPSPESVITKKPDVQTKATPANIIKGIKAGDSTQLREDLDTATKSFIPDTRESFLKGLDAKNPIERTARAAETVVNLPKELFVRPLARRLGSLAIDEKFDTAALSTGGVVRSPKSTIEARTKFYKSLQDKDLPGEKWLFGEEPVRPYSEEAAEFEDLGEQLGTVVGEKVSDNPTLQQFVKKGGRLAGTLGFAAMAASDVVPFDVGKNVKKKIAKEAIEELIEKTLKETGEKLTRETAEKILKESGEEIVERGGRKLLDLAVPPAKAGTVDDIATRLPAPDRDRLLRYSDYVADGAHKKPSTRDFDLEADVTDILERNGVTPAKTPSANAGKAGDLLDLDSRRTLYPTDRLVQQADEAAQASGIARPPELPKAPTAKEKTQDMVRNLIKQRRPSEAYGAALGMEPQFDEDGKLTGFNYDPVKGLVGVAGMSVSNTKLGKEVLGKMKEARDRYLNDFLSNSETGRKILDRFNLDKNAREVVMERVGNYVDPKDLASAIKSIPSYKAEKAIPDWATQATILEKGGKYRLAVGEETQKLVQEGFSVRGYMDEIIGEDYGQDAQPFLQNFLDAYEGKLPKDELALADDFLAKSDPNYRELAEALKKGEPSVLPEGAGFSTADEITGGAVPPNADDLTRAFDNPNAKELGFLKTVRDADITAQEVREAVQGTYNPITNKETLAKAQEFVAKSPDEALKRVRSEGMTAENVAIAEVLIKRAQDAGDYEIAIDLVEELAGKAKTSGQAIQALSMWSRLTPEGSLRYTQRLIDRANDARKITDPQKKLRLSPDAAKDITDIAKTIQKKKQALQGLEDIAKLPDKTERKEAFKTMLRELTPEEIKGMFQDVLPDLGVLDYKLKDVDVPDVPKLKGEQPKIPGTDALDKNLVDATAPNVPKVQGDQAVIPGTDVLDRDIVAAHLADLSPEDMAKTIQGALPGMEAKLLDMMASQVPPTILKKISTLQTMAQLLNPKTFIRNILGNAGFAGFENITDVVGAGIDKGLSLITGKRTRMLPDLKAQAKGFTKGAKLGLEDAIRGIDTSASQAGKFEIADRTFRGQKVLGSKTVGKGLEVLEKGMNLSLKAPDRAFYQAAFDGELSNLMRIADVTTPTEQMLELAHLQALRRTFQDNNAISRSLGSFKKLLNVNKEWGAGDLLIKYPKTPGAILHRGIEYSPVGFIRPLFDIASAVTGGKLTKQTFDQRRFVDALARATIGTTGLVGAGAVLYNKGILTGKKDKNASISDLQNDQGGGQYKINVSALKRWVLSGFNDKEAKAQPEDVTYTYDWFQPAAIGVTIGANTAEARKLSAQDAISQTVAGVASTADTLIEQPLFSGVRNFFNVLAYGGSFGDALTNTLKDLPASMVPTFFNQVRQISDNTSRETYDPNVIQEALNRVKNKVPGLASTLPARGKLIGETRENYRESPTGKNTIFNVMFNPGFVAKLKNDPEAQEVLRLYEMTGETKQAPDFVKKKQKLLGEEWQLTGAQFAEMQRYAGAQNQKKLQGLVRNPNWGKIPDDKKVNLITQELGKVMAEARAKPFMEHMGITSPDWFPPSAQNLILTKLAKSDSFKKLSSEQKKQVLQIATDKLAAVLQAKGVGQK